MQRAAAVLFGLCLVAGTACTGETEHSAAEGPLESESIFTVPDGARSAEIMDLVQRSELLTGHLESAQLREGWLAPGDYTIAHGMERSEIIKMMVERQEGRLGAFWEYRAPNLPLTKPEELVVLASLVECEAPSPKFIGSVASVFVNRLRHGMRLQSDAALTYGITRGKMPLDRPLRPSDLKQDTPWNTYLHKGLPSTPICAPSIDAIGSTSQPLATEYLYFVSDAAGGLVFAKTLAEHNANIAEFRKAIRPKGEQ